MRRSHAGTLRVARARAGIIPARRHSPSLLPSAPLVLEVGSEDTYQWASMHELSQRLASTALLAELYFREVDGGHAISARRMDSFLRWARPGDGADDVAGALAAGFCASFQNH
jgi:predicted esterase